MGGEVPLPDAVDSKAGVASPTSGTATAIQTGTRTKRAGILAKPSPWATGRSRAGPSPCCVGFDDESNNNEKFANDLANALRIPTVSSYNANKLNDE